MQRKTTPVPTKFRKKPVEIEAIQFGRHPVAGIFGVPIGLFNEEPPEWAIEAIKDGTISLGANAEGFLVLNIKTLEGPIVASPNDWVIRGVKGELYPCKPDIFEMTYERVENVN